MSNELVPASEEKALTSLADLKALAVQGKYTSEEAFGQMASDSFLPRLQLMGSSSGPVKDGKIQQGRFAVVRGKDQVEDLTPEVVVLPVGWRPKAIKFGDDEVESAFDHTSKRFKEIVAEADSGKQDTGCQYGPEFLLWIPSTQIFATYHMGNTSARREAPQLKGFIMKSAARLKCHLVTGKKHKWHAPIVTMCSDPIRMPDATELKAELEKFMNPPETVTEEAAPASGERPR